VTSFFGKIQQARSLTRRLSRGDALQLAFSAPNQPARQLAVKGISAPLFLRPGTVDVTVFEKIFLSLEYELPFPLSPRRIVDAGAHVGLASRFFAQRYPDSRIIALEPMESNLAVLRQNAAACPQIEVLPGALWGRPAALSGSGGESWSHAMSESPAPGPTIRGVTVPDLLRLTGWDRIDLLKVDVEGAEREVFCDEAQAWLPRVDAIAIELHDRSWAGCSTAFYRQISPQLEAQEVRGETVFVRLRP
jgi:FkbM family methyltransferase